MHFLFRIKTDAEVGILLVVRRCVLVCVLMLAECTVTPHWGIARRVQQT